ncbi:unnamed protein product, partial [Cyprideis torosa]
YLLAVIDLSHRERVKAVRRDFVANVSHELRSPLTAIRGYVEALAERQSEIPQGERIVGGLLRQTRRMNLMVDDLLQLTKIETAKPFVPEEQTPLALKAFCQELVAQIDDQQRQERDFAVKVPGKILLLIGRKKLFSLVNNLVENAIRHTAPDGRIDIRWRKLPQGGELQVRDNGEGIPAAHLPRVTERFYRVDSGRSRDAGGTGLGLAIVKHQMLRIGGDLRIASRPGIGTTVTLHFPPRVVKLAALSVDDDTDDVTLHPELQERGVQFDAKELP